jgi:hypothetical protein
MLLDRHQLLSVCIVQGESGCGGKRHVHFQYPGFSFISKDI